MWKPAFGKMNSHALSTKGAVRAGIPNGDRKAVRAAITTLTLYNNMGEKVWQQDAGKISGTVYKDISLRDQLPAGTYMMVVRRDDIRLMQKIVINK